MAVDGLIEKMKEMGFEIISQEDDGIHPLPWAWVLRRETEDSVAQVYVMRKG